MTKRKNMVEPLLWILLIGCIFLDQQYLNFMWHAQIIFDILPFAAYRFWIFPLTAVLAGRFLAKIIFQTRKNPIDGKIPAFLNLASKVLLAIYFLISGIVLLICYYISPSGSGVMTLVDILEKVSRWFLLFFAAGVITEIQPKTADKFFASGEIVIIVVCVLLSAVYIFGKTVSKEEFETAAKTEAAKYDVELTLDFGSRTRLTPFDLERELWVIRGMDSSYKVNVK